MHYIFVCNTGKHNKSSLFTTGKSMHVSPSQSRTTLGLPKPYLGLDKHVGLFSLHIAICFPTCIHLSNAMSSFLLKANSDNEEESSLLHAKYYLRQKEDKPNLRGCTRIKIIKIQNIHMCKLVSIDFNSII